MAFDIGERVRVVTPLLLDYGLAGTVARRTAVPANVRGRTRGGNVYVVKFDKGVKTVSGKREIHVFEYGLARA